MATNKPGPGDRPQLQIVYRPIDGLIPYAMNSRTHAPEQVAQIAASIREFGFTNPILIDDEGTIIAGHGRVMAAQKLKLTDAPTITLSGLTDAQRRAYVIADNKLALNAGWDENILAAEIDALREMEFDTGLLGFSKVELKEIGVEPPGDGDGAKDATGDPNSGYQEQYGVIVICENAAEQEAVYNELSEAGKNCRVVCT